CACCRKSRSSVSGYTTCYRGIGPRSIGITLCVNTGNQNDTYADVFLDLTHELRHALDCCMGRLENCDDIICSEINAYNLDGSCSGKVGDAYKNCVVDAALSSVLSNFQTPCKGTPAQIRKKISDM